MSFTAVIKSAANHVSAEFQLYYHLRTSTELIQHANIERQQAQVLRLSKVIGRGHCNGVTTRNVVHTFPASLITALNSEDDVESKKKTYKHQLIRAYLSTYHRIDAGFSTPEKYMCEDSSTLEGGCATRPPMRRSDNPHTALPASSYLAPFFKCIIAFSMTSKTYLHL